MYFTNFIISFFRELNDLSIVMTHEYNTNIYLNSIFVCYLV